MTLTAGHSLSFYEILGPLGAGAMGEVYLAKDTRLEREVAIKVLPEHFAADEERLRRFEREAKSLASLNHPNVAQIFSVDQSDDTCFLVLELVPGETLEERIARGVLPIEEAVDVCSQIADGLEAAHEAGVIHRDLKPANVRITPDGKVKVLDFGLAKPTGPDADTESTSDSVLATEAGRLLGTPIYMAPEQARGKPIDRRVDVWAFGCVLFECLTGKRAFDGDSMADVLAAVVHEEAGLERLPETTPAHVRNLIERCLHKDSRQRLRDIGEARILLLTGEQALVAASGAEASTVVTGSRYSPGLVVAALIAGAALAIGTVAITGGWSSPQPRPAIRAFLDLPPSLELDADDRAIALSPDGSQVALVAKDRDSGTAQIYLRALDRLELTILEGTAGASYPFWSPDGTALGFFADLKLKRIDFPAGIVRTLCAAPAGRGAAWSPEGFVVFAPSASGPLYQVPEGGGKPTAFTTLASDREHHRLPQFLPEGRGILYAAYGVTAPDAQDAYWAPMDEGMAVFGFHPESGRVCKILDSVTEAFYVEPGFLAFVKDSNLMIQPFDSESFELSGEPRPIAADVASDWSRMFVQLDFGTDGALVYQETSKEPGMRLSWLDRTGLEAAIPADPLHVSHARVSPDGSRAAISMDEPNGGSAIVLVNLDRGISSRLNPLGTYASAPAWSRDGRHLALQTLVRAHFQLAMVELQKGEAPRALTHELGVDLVPDVFTSDGRILFSQRSQSDKQGDLMFIDASGGSPKSALLSGTTNDQGTRLSPNGQWFVFGTFPDGADADGGSSLTVGATLSISNFPSTGRWPITGPDASVRIWGWISDREIYWQDAEGLVFVVELTLDEDGKPQVGAPEQLFEASFDTARGDRIVDFSPAREQFLVARRAEAGSRARLVVVSDWDSAP